MLRVCLVLFPMNLLAINHDEELFAVYERQNSGAIITFINAKSHLFGRAVGNEFDTLIFI